MILENIIERIKEVIFKKGNGVIHFKQEELYQKIKRIIERKDI